MCGCNSAAFAPAGPTGAGAASVGEKWRVTYPNGAAQEFGQEWAAVQAQALSGGVMEKVEPAPTG
jgi:hypothetical protein